MSEKGQDRKVSLRQDILWMRSGCDHNIVIMYLEKAIIDVTFCFSEIIFHFELK